MARIEITVNRTGNESGVLSGSTVGIISFDEANPEDVIVPNPIDYKTLIGEILAGGIKRWRERQDRGKAQPATSAATAGAAQSSTEPNAAEPATPDPPMAEPSAKTPTLGALLTEN